MSNGWEQKTLGEVVHFSGGGTPSKKVDQYWNGDIPWVSPKDMKSRLISTSIDMITEEGIRKSSAKLIPTGSVLIVIRSGILSRTVPIGITTKELAVNQDLKALVPNHGIITTEYLYNFLASAEQQILDLVTRGATVHRLSMDHLKSIPISIPPLSEQKRIVAILDEAFGAIARAKENAARNLANARELFDSYLNRVFTEKGDGWEEKRLADAVTEIATGPFGSLLHKSDYVTGGIPLVNPINIEGTSIVANYSKTITAQKLEELRPYTLCEGDIVIGRRGEMGRCAVISENEDGWVCGTGCFIIRTSEDVNPHFLCHMLRSNKYKELMGNDSDRATMPSISNKQLGNLPTSFPEIEQQKEVVLQLDNLKRTSIQLEGLYKQKLVVLDELKQSLLQKAFTGQLTSTTKELELVP